MNSRFEEEQRSLRPDEAISDAIVNIEVEQELLGTILMNNDTMSLVSEFLEDSHFFEPIHRKIYDVAQDMIRAGKNANPITIKTFLPEHDKIGEITLATYLARLAASAASPVMMPTNAKLIYDLAKRRQLLIIGENLIRDARNMAVDVDPKDLGEATISNISSAISDDDGIYGATAFGDALDEALENTNTAYSGKKPVGVNYRFPPLERLIGPLCGGQLIILGGATKQGKSALAGQLAMGAASEGVPVWFYSGEMTAVELAMRESSRETKVSVNRQKRGKVQEPDFERLVEFRNTNRDKPIFIQQKRLTLDMIMERCRQFVKKKGKGLFIIDHIGLVERSHTERNLSDWEFGQIVTMRLKMLARELDCPVIGCAQLKKNTFNESSRGPVNEKFLNAILARRPKYVDLIGAMERDADHVIIPFRPYVFLMEYEPAEDSHLRAFWEDLAKDNENKAKIVLALSRESRWPRDVDTGWDGATTTFYDLGGGAELEVAAELAANPMMLI